MIWRRARKRGSEDGQALVEFALVSPLLLLLILGVVEFARAWNTQQVLTEAARDALRSAVVANPGFTYDDLVGMVDSALVRASLDPSLAQISVDGWRAGSGTQARITIDYQYDFGFFGPFVDWAAKDRTLALSTTFVMRNE